MFLGISDPWVAWAFCGNLLITAICVIYGVITYNRGDDSQGETHR